MDRAHPNNKIQTAQKAPYARRRGARNEAYFVCTPQRRATLTTTQMGFFSSRHGGETLKVLGIDPGSINTGYGIVGRGPNGSLIPIYGRANTPPASPSLAD